MRLYVVLKDGSSFNIELAISDAYPPSPTDYMRMLTDIPNDSRNGYMVTGKEGDCLFFDYDHVVVMMVVK